MECYIQCNKFFFWRIPNDKFFPRFSIQILNIWKNELWSSGVWIYLHFLILACHLFILCFIQSLILTDTKMFSIKSLFFFKDIQFFIKEVKFWISLRLWLHHYYLCFVIFHESNQFSLNKNFTTKLSYLIIIWKTALKNEVDERQRISLLDISLHSFFVTLLYSSMISWCLFCYY